jgi:hypothetical protein
MRKHAISAGVGTRDCQPPRRAFVRACACAGAADASVLCRMQHTTHTWHAGCNQPADAQTYDRACVRSPASSSCSATCACVRMVRLRRSPCATSRAAPNAHRRHMPGRTHARTHAHTHAHARAHACTHARTCTRACMHARTHMHARMRACTHARTCMHADTHTHVRMRARMRSPWHARPDRNGAGGRTASGRGRLTLYCARPHLSAPSRRTRPCCGGRAGGRAGGRGSGATSTPRDLTAATSACRSSVSTRSLA